MRQKHSQSASCLLLVLSFSTALSVAGCVPHHTPVHGERDRSDDPAFSKYPGSEELEEQGETKAEKAAGSEKGTEESAKAKDRPIRLHGRAMVEDRTGDTPLKDARIGLVSADNLMAGETTTNGNGYFTLNGKFKPGRYRLKVLSGSYSSSHQLEIDGQSIDDIEVRVEKQNPGKKKELSN